MDHTAHPGSFRDPSGFVFIRDGVLYRQINRAYESNYEQLRQSGLYDCLTAACLLVAHDEISAAAADESAAWCIIRPQRVPFVSYPYEWCFGQLKDAALCTLEIQRVAIEHGMTLKDASAYNVQFHNGRPIWIDTLSFTGYSEGEPWVAYRQFCQHFLAPLAVMAYTDVRLGRLLQTFLDGLPLDLAAQMLPWQTRLRLPLLLHLHLHARAQRAAHRSAPAKQSDHGNFSRRAMLGLIDSLQSGIRRLSLNVKRTTWSDYYNETNYTSGSMEHKRQIVAGFLQRLKPSTVWDMGANTGQFSRLAAEQGAKVVALDFDALAVERSYQQLVQRQETRVLPLVQDLFNPSPSLGWNHRERMSLVERGPADVVLALALVHHLAIGNNVPLQQIAEFFAALGEHLIIEFVPRDDSQVVRMLYGREEQFSDYSQTQFESSFSQRFRIQEKVLLEESQRTIYLLSRSD